ncbi:TetR/AcrR family transcriptional regulator [Plantactinospora alkalitolerans]|uniref:TetR/AcrR family transcriptional regulator n=1 Tax=Plantactinospora alkalitolerans TaxID=2789879 RepID=UPI001E650E66|nr:TetR family transcriptional regulator C-terminal domain-containing protein [Plantactinospora alkalitolerans]
MPKIVDEEIRRTQLAEAVWRVVRRDGLQQASVRNVAQEAGLSAGSLRNSFASQSDLMVFAMRLVGERIRIRLDAVDPTGDPAEFVRRIIAEMLPLDAERRTECEVWLAFSARSLVDPALRPLREQTHHLLTQVFTNLVDRLAEAGLIRAGLDRQLEADRLYVLTDGLILHGVLHGEPAHGGRASAIVTAHLAELGCR